MYSEDSSDMEDSDDEVVTIDLSVLASFVASMTDFETYLKNELGEGDPDADYEYYDEEEPGEEGQAAEDY